MSFIKWLSTSFIVLLLTACSQPERAANEIWIGTIAGPETDLMEIAQKVAKKQFNLNIKIIEFEDYTTPNTALAEGSIDANLFQHQPYLDVAVKNQGYPIESIGKVFIYPMGIYSKKTHHLSELRKGAIVAIPNDPSNGARALRLLAQEKLISIQDDGDLVLTPKEIHYNPLSLVIKELEAAQLPRILEDVDIAIINTNYAVPADLLPNRDALALENKDSPYANIVVVRSKDKEDPKYQNLLAALHSDEVIEEAKKIFQGQAIKAW